MNRTALYDLHVQAGAKMVDFAGWQMPLQYTSIQQEHRTTRQACTMFDVSHMGRLTISGSDSEPFLEYLCTRRIGSMVPGQCRYTHVCQDDGGILDDIIVSRFADKWLLVCNASNREKIVRWIERHANGRQVVLQDQTLQTVMLAIQGPDVAEVAEDMLPVDVSDIKRYRFKSGKYMGIEYICSRTGYTGEDGYELILPRAAGKMLAGNILREDGSAYGRVTPAGLGARNTLRLEAGMPLYGHELSEQVDSLTAGQSWCVDLSKDFLGGDAMRRIQQQGVTRQLVGLEIEGKRIARQDTPIEADGRPIGTVTSGTQSPTLQKVIAMATVEVPFAEVGTALQADIRGRRSNATVVPLPFYKKSKNP